MATKYFSFGKAEPIVVTSIRLSTGQVRTNPDTFTAEELADVGATGPYTQPDYDSLTHELSWDSTNLRWSVVEKPANGGLTTEELWDAMRSERNARLLETDQLMVSDYVITDAQKALLLTYRSSLRDLPANTSDPANVTWPTPPACVVSHFGL